MRTIGSELEKNRGIGPGFDFLRIALALSVLFTHSIIVIHVEDHQFDTPPFRLLHDSIIPMFFALSGFLITGSAMRLKLKDFILNRGMRIVPALAVDIFVSALVIGPIFTTFPLRDYLTDHRFFLYFANICGWIHYALPGVFTNNPTSGIVNGSLWTVPLEIGCYIIMSGFIFWNLLKKKRAALAITVLFALFITLGFWAGFDPRLPVDDLISGAVAALLRLFFSTHQEYYLPRGEMLYVYFLTGCLFYLFRNRILFNSFVFAACLAVVAVGAFRGFDFMPPILQAWLYYPTLVYITVFIGLSKIPRIPLYSRGDYSYGIYLYGYPLQQAITLNFPALISPLLHFAASMVLTSLVAMASWHLIEKPVLGLRRKFSFTARKGDERLAIPHPNPAIEKENKGKD